MKSCIACSEQIQDAAKKCRFCGQWQSSAEARPPKVAPFSETPRPNSRWRRLLSATVAACLLAGGVAAFTMHQRRSQPDATATILEGDDYGLGSTAQAPEAAPAPVDSMLGFCRAVLTCPSLTSGVVDRYRKTFPTAEACAKALTIDFPRMRGSEPLIAAFSEYCARYSVRCDLLDECLGTMNDRRRRAYKEALNGAESAARSTGGKLVGTPQEFEFARKYVANTLFPRGAAPVWNGGNPQKIETRPGTAPPSVPVPTRALPAQRGVCYEQCNTGYRQCAGGCATLEGRCALRCEEVRDQCFEGCLQ